MATTFNPSEHFSQFSAPRDVPSLPPYERVETTTIPPADHSSSSSSSDLPQDSSRTENRKSNAVSISQVVDDHGHIKGWPSQPRKLRNRTIFTFLFNLCEALVTLAPAAFIVFAVLAAKLDGQPTHGNGLGHNVKLITQLGPSIYPIMFAAVAGKSLKTFARYYAEKGMRLGMLELLLASQTVWGTFASQLLLRNFTFVGVQLFLLWSLSPLGGQGSLRVLTTGMAAVSNNGSDIVYLPTGSMIMNLTSGVFAQADAASGLAATNSLYNANLLTPGSTKASGQDMWGNIKVPTLKTIAGVDLSTDGWGVVPPELSADDYISLAGLPISGLINRAGTLLDFSFDTGYVELECPTLRNVSKYDGTWQKDLGFVWSADNGSTAFGGKDTPSQTSFYLDTNTPSSNDRIVTRFYDQDATTLADLALQRPRNIVYGSQYEVLTSDDPRGSFALAIRNCTVQQRYVEAHARCKEDGCAVISIRSSPKYAKRNPNLTPFEDLSTAYNLMKKMPLATGTFRTGDSGPTELYIRGAEMPFDRLSSDQPAMLNTSNEVFTPRFQLLLNTYYQLSLAPLSYTGSLPGPTDPVWNLPLVESAAGGSTGDLPFAPLRTNSTVTTTFEVYRCNYVWFSILLISSIILLLLGSVGTALAHLCHAPDILGFVSSFTYNNPYMSVPPGGESLGAMERARLLKNVKVKIGDATADQDVGHVVFATLHRSSTVGDLNAAKLYR